MRRARVTTELALDWATLPENAQPASLANRLTMVRQFASYLRTIDPATEVPPSRLLRAGNRRATPYIYTDSEIAALIDAAAMLRYPLLIATYRTLIGLLAVSGLRVGEAIRLDTGRHRLGTRAADRARHQVRQDQAGAAALGPRSRHSTTTSGGAAGSTRARSRAPQPCSSPPPARA